MHEQHAVGGDAVEVAALAPPLGGLLAQEDAARGVEAGGVEAGGVRRRALHADAARVARDGALARGGRGRRTKQT